MRSPVGWLYFGIVVLGVISVESNYQNNYQVVPGSSYPATVPTYNYLSYVPQGAVRAVVQQNTYGDDDHADDEDSGEERYPSHDDLRTGMFNGRAGGKDDEEDIKPQAYINYGQNPYAPALGYYYPSVVQSPNQVLYRLVSNQQYQDLPTQRVTKLTKSKEQKASFVATPVADLILRLSISLARPSENENNSTLRNISVPIRLTELNTNVNEHNATEQVASIDTNDVETAKQPSELKTVTESNKNSMTEDAEGGEAKDPISN